MTPNYQICTCVEIFAFTVNFENHVNQSNLQILIWLRDRIYWISLYLVSRRQVGHAFIIPFPSVPWQRWRNARIHWIFLSITFVIYNSNFFKVVRYGDRQKLVKSRCFYDIQHYVKMVIPMWPFILNTYMYEFSSLRHYPHVQGPNMITVMPCRCSGMVGSLATLKLLKIKHVPFQISLAISDSLNNVDDLDSVNMTYDALQCRNLTICLQLACCGRSCHILFCFAYLTLQAPGTVCFRVVRPCIRPPVRLSVRLFVRPKPEIRSFHLYMGPLVHPANRDRFSACPSVRLFIRPDWFPGISWGTHGGNSLRFCVLMYPDHLPNWLGYGYDLLIFLVLAPLLLSETGQIGGFRTFPEKCMEGVAWNCACWYILITVQTDWIYFTVCWFF